MDSVKPTGARILGATIQSLGRFIPEPKSSSSISFSSVLNGIGSALGGVAGMAGIDPGYAQLLQEQIQTQEQMQLVSMASNIEKSKHETNMAVVRNARVG